MAGPPANIDRKLAGTILKSSLKPNVSRANTILTRHPFAIAWTIIALIAVLVLATDLPGKRPEASSQNAPGKLTAPPTVSGPITHPRRQVVRGAAHALERIEHACGRTQHPEGIGRVDRPVHQIVSFAEHYPNGRFTLGGESATTLALLTVTHSLLEGCDAASAERVQDLMARLSS